MNGNRVRPFDYDECNFYLDCVSGLLDALQEAIYNDPNQGPNFAEALYGVKLLVDYINADVEEAADREVRQNYLESLREKASPSLTGDIKPLQDR